jgi:hypothetical protein
MLASLPYIRYTTMEGGGYLQIGGLLQVLWKREPH